MQSMPPLQTKGIILFRTVAGRTIFLLDSAGDVIVFSSRQEAIHTLKESEHYGAAWEFKSLVRLGLKQRRAFIEHQDAT